MTTPIPLTTTNLAGHVVQLAAAFSIYIHLIEEAVDAVAGHVPIDSHLPLDDQRKIILIAPVTGEITYAIALHEMGHLLAPFGQVTLSQASVQMRLTSEPTTRSDVRLQLQEEEAAWEWARHYALDWTTRMSDIQRRSFDRYLATARSLGVTWEAS